MSTASSLITSGTVAIAGSATLAAIVNAFFTKGSRRAEESKTLSDMSHSITDQVVGENRILHQEMVQVKQALIVLTEFVDMLLARGILDAQLSPEEVKAFREANRAAKLSATTGLRSRPIADIIDAHRRIRDR